MKSSGELMMPQMYAEMGRTEMELIEGGQPINLEMSSVYLSRTACKNQAAWLKRTGYCVNMNSLDIAKEIFGHACAYYAGEAVKSKNPSLSGIVNSVVSSAQNGIYLEDNNDSAIRVAYYNACWALPVGRD